MVWFFVFLFLSSIVLLFAKTWFMIFKKRKIPLGFSLIILLGIASFIGMLASAGREMRDGTQGNSSQVIEFKTQEQSNDPRSLIPESQSVFAQTIKTFTDEYSSAPNDLKKSAVRMERKQAMQRVMNGSTVVKEWVGTLEDMGTNGDGNAYMTISLEGSDVKVKTMNNAFSDMQYPSMIKNGSALFKDLSNMAKGEKIIFEGQFIKNDLDYFAETSMTEYGSMNDPEFVMKFNSIRKISSQFPIVSR